MSVSAELISWYSAHRRVLPWREDPTPYHVYLSEIMLQQTRVETVKPYYERFLSALPDIPSLAKADEDLYIKLWEGLGYYSRVRNLSKSAKRIVEEFGGEVPGDYDSLRKLSGVGEYTAKAILSIAFQKPCIAVDGNLVRVYSRLEEQALEPSEKMAKESCEAFFLENLGEARPGDFNQALMDLGEMVCLPNGQPLCDRCPFQNRCKAHLHHSETAYPLPKKKPEKKAMPLTVFLIWHGDKLQIEKRESQSLLSQTYGLRTQEGHLTLEEAKRAASGLGFHVKRISSGPKAKHVFSHRVWDMVSYVLEVENEIGLFATKKEIAEKYAIPSAFSKFL